MIDYTTIRASVEGKIATLSLGIAVEHENAHVGPLLSEHIKVINTDISAHQVAMGAGRIVKGVIIFEIYTKIGIGTGKARGMAKTLCSSLTGDAIAEITFTGEGELISIGPTEDGELYQHNLMIPYMCEYGA